MNQQEFAVFRPQRALIVAVVVAVAVVVGLTISALHVQHGGATGWTSADSYGMIGFGVIVALCVLRFGLVRAIPSPSGLVVHNLVRTHRVAWEDIVSVQFGGGAPWLVLDLADTEQLTVMAVQRADGGRGDREAVRLATLVERHTQTSQND